MYLLDVAPTALCKSRIFIITALTDCPVRCRSFRAFTTHQHPSPTTHHLPSPTHQNQHPTPNTPKYVKMKYETKVLTTKYQKPDAYGALSMPVYHTAAFEFPSAKAMSDAFCGRSMEPSYARIANPTVTYLEERVRQITGAVSVTVTSWPQSICSATAFRLSVIRWVVWV